MEPMRPVTKRWSNCLNKGVRNWLHTEGTTVFLWSILSMSMNQCSPALWAASSSTRPCANHCLKIKVPPQAILQEFTEIVLLAWALLDEQFQVITHTAPSKHAHALGNNNPRALYSPSFQKCRQSSHHNALLGCNTLGVCRSAPGSTPQRRRLTNAFPLSGSLCSPISTKRRSRRFSRALLGSIWLFGNLAPQSCFTSLEHVSAVVVIVEHLSARREVGFFVHWAHLRV